MKDTWPVVDKSKADIRGASALQSVLNDLKRDVFTAATELEVPAATLNHALAGHRDALATVLEAAVDRWPVARRDLLTAIDDTIDNVMIWSSDRALATSRVLVRGGLEYYEYRDTAMSRISPIRPEWIRMLARTQFCNASDPGLRWNRGHGLHQLTLFLGDVDFYYEESGLRVSRAMRQGDSAFIPSWIPHTFAAREGISDASIVAVTFRGRLTADALDDLALAWNEFRPDDLRSSSDPYFGRQLLAKLSEATLTTEWLAAVTGISLARIRHFIADEEAPDAGEAAAIGTALNVAPGTLMGTSKSCGVVIQSASERKATSYPSIDKPVYRIEHLALSSLSPDTQGLVIDVLGSNGMATEKAALRFGLHQYAFVIGLRPVILTWWSDGRRLERQLLPGDSFYMKPWTEHAFSLLTDGFDAVAQIFSFRCRGALGSDAIRELAMQEPQALKRFRDSQLAWYD